MSDSFTLSSSSVVLPGRGRYGSNSKSRKPTYWQSVATIGIQVADALEYAHKQGVQHRDIKPSNLLLDTQETVWVTDFGLAKAEDQPNLTHTGDILGTLRYMPPEAFEGKTDARSDVYSLGLTLYEMLAFRPAFDEKERNRLIRQVTQEVPPRLGKSVRSLPRDLETIVSKAIDREPGRRYQTAALLAADLQRFVDDEPIRARRASLPERSWRWCKRNPLVAGLTAALALVFLAGFAGVTWKWRDAEWQKDRARAAQAREAAERGEADRERRRAENNLYHSLVREAQAIRRLRDGGYRREVWDRLKQALALETPDKDLAQLRQEAVACLGDFVGLAPTIWADLASEIHAVEVHPDGQHVVLGLADGSILVRNLSTGAEVARLHEHRAPVVSLSLDAAGTRMASGDRGGVVKVWQAHADGAWVSTRTMAIDRPVPNDQVTSYREPVSVVLSSDGKWLFISSMNQPGVALWDLTRGTRSQTFETPAPGTLAGLALSPDGKLLAAGYNENRILVWDVASRALKHNLPSEVGWIYDLVFSSTGHHLAYAGNSGVAVLEGSQFQRLTIAQLRGLSFSPLEPGRKVGGICGLPIRAHPSLGDGNEPGSRQIETGQCLGCPFQPGRQVSCRSWELAAQRSSNLAPRRGPREARRGRAYRRSSRRRFQSGRPGSRVGRQRPCGQALGSGQRPTHPRAVGLSRRGAIARLQPRWCPSGRRRLGGRHSLLAGIVLARAVGPQASTGPSDLGLHLQP